MYKMKVKSSTTNNVLLDYFPENELVYKFTLYCPTIKSSAFPHLSGVDLGNEIKHQEYLMFMKI